jgi:hypothetical protein
VAANYCSEDGRSERFLAWRTHISILSSLFLLSVSFFYAFAKLEKSEQI